MDKSKRMAKNTLKLLLIPLFGGVLLVAMGFEVLGIVVGAGSLVGLMVFGELVRHGERGR